MPKDTGETLTSRSHLDSAQVTTPSAGTEAGQKSRAGADASVAPVQPPSQWRASRVRVDSKLAKTLALQQYRLKQEDIKGLSFEKRGTVVAGKKRDMFLYKERDIERKAWERYGGPDGFEAYLKTLHDKHVEAKGSRAPFVRPSSYKIAGSKAPLLHQSVRASASKTKPVTAVKAPIPTVDKAASEAALARIKQAMQPWLWDACTYALDADIEPTDFTFEGSRLFRRVPDRVRPMKDALDEMKWYPVRPTKPLPPSASVDKLRAVLAASARLPKGIDFGVEVEGLVYCSCFAPDEIEWYEWSAEYLERLFAAILEVVDEHGLGEAGWATVRWEIYDKTFGEGIKYYRNSKIWVDKGAEWLGGQLAGRAMKLSCRAKCASGKEFNEALPSERVGGYRRVGNGFYV